MKGRIIMSKKMIDNELFAPNFGAVDIMNSQTQRLVVMFLIDISRSVERYKDILHDSMIKMRQSLYNDDITRVSTEVGIMLFNTKRETVLPIREIYNQQDNDYDLELECKGRTHTGEAVMEAVSAIEDRSQMLRKAGKHQYVPVLVLITDGNPNFASCAEKQGRDTLEKAYSTISDKVRNKELQVIVMGIGDRCDEAVLQKLAGGNVGNKPLKITDASKLASYFDFISKSVGSASHGNGVLNNDDFEELYEEDDDDEYDFFENYGDLDDINTEGD